MFLARAVGAPDDTITVGSWHNLVAYGISSLIWSPFGVLMGSAYSLTTLEVSYENACTKAPPPLKTLRTPDFLGGSLITPSVPDLFWVLDLCAVICEREIAVAFFILSKQSISRQEGTRRTRCVWRVAGIRYCIRCAQRILDTLKNYCIFKHDDLRRRRSVFVCSKLLLSLKADVLVPASAGDPKLPNGSPTRPPVLIFSKPPWRVGLIRQALL